MAPWEKILSLIVVETFGRSVCLLPRGRFGSMRASMNGSQSFCVNVTNCYLTFFLIPFLFDS